MRIFAITAMVFVLVAHAVSVQAQMSADDAARSTPPKPVTVQPASGLEADMLSQLSGVWKDLEKNTLVLIKLDGPPLFIKLGSIYPPRAIVVLGVDTKRSTVTFRYEDDSEDMIYTLQVTPFGLAKFDPFGTESDLRFVRALVPSDLPR